MEQVYGDEEFRSASMDFHEVIDLGPLNEPGPKM